MSIRTSGILLHPTSLPSRFGIGDLGPGAYRFADLLAATGQQYWQMLPVTPTEAAHDHSPYHGVSAFAGDPLWISPDLLVKNGWLKTSDLAEAPDVPTDRVEFTKVRDVKNPMLEKAFARFENGWNRDAVAHFARQTRWLSDAALFRVLTRQYGEPWSEWPQPLRDRRKDALKEAGRRFSAALRREVFFQYLFSDQWQALKRHCNRRGVQLIGDMPIYLPFHSADVWSSPHLYKLAPDRSPAAVSGVPPDYFSRTGQVWGHPVYDWDALLQSGFDWWLRRTAHHLDLFDRVRIDHFRGWVAYWEVPADEKTAVNGKWVPAPGDRLLDALSRRFSCLPLIAEDLGTITADVRETMSRFDLPGMRVLQFAFGGDFPHGSFLPHNYVRNCVAYTGTHDNNTTSGWFGSEAGERERKNLFRYLGREPASGEIHWEMIRLAMGSVADTAVIPLQDLLGLGEGARMNRPAGKGGNWRWRAPQELLPRETADRFAQMTRTYGRAPAGNSG